MAVNYTFSGSAALTQLLTNIVRDFVRKQAGKDLSTEDFTSALKAKLEGLLSPVDNLTSTSTEAPLSANQGRVLSGLIDTINANMPTAVSDLDNDLLYQTATEVITYVTDRLSELVIPTEAEIEQMINDAIAAVTHIQIKPVDALPTGSDIEENVIYLVPSGQAGKRFQYVWDAANSEWVQIGDTDVEMDNYYTKAEADALLDEKVSEVNVHVITAMELDAIYEQVINA